VAKSSKIQGYRSKLELDVSRHLALAGVPFKYENIKLKYRVEELRCYTPDFDLGNGIVLEVKGYFRATDRKKLLLVKQQHPDLDLRLVFQQAQNKIHKSSKTTYADWCKKYGFPYSDGGRVPHQWLKPLS
jgi:hypothetical protein